MRPRLGLVAHGQNIASQRRLAKGTVEHCSITARTVPQAMALLRLGTTSEPSASTCRCCTAFHDNRRLEIIRTMADLHARLGSQITRLAHFKECRPIFSAIAARRRENWHVVCSRRPRVFSPIRQRDSISWLRDADQAHCSEMFCDGGIATRTSASMDRRKLGRADLDARYTADFAILPPVWRWSICLVCMPKQSRSWSSSDDHVVCGQHEQKLESVKSRSFAGGFCPV